MRQQDWFYRFLQDFFAIFNYDGLCDNLVDYWLGRRTMYQKLLWAVIGVVMVVSGVLLWRTLPHQGWVIQDAQGEWQVVAEGWALLWRCWPLVVVGAVFGFWGTLWVFLPGLQGVRELDLRRAVAEARAQRDAAFTVALERVAAREAMAEHRERAAQEAQAAAELAQQEAKLAAEEADAMWESAEDVQELAGEEINRANARVRNAVHTLQRIRRQALKRRPQKV